MCCKELKTLLGGNIAYYDKKSVASEQKGRFEIITQKDFCRIKVDGGIINNEEIAKCDYLFVICDKPKKFYFVELKSASKINRAYEQICSAINTLKPMLNIAKADIHGIIASKSLPNKANQDYRNLKIKFAKEVGTSLEKSNLLRI